MSCLTEGRFKHLDKMYIITTELTQGYHTAESTTGRYTTKLTSFNETNLQELC